MHIAECGFAVRNNISEFCPCHVDFCDLTCSVSCQKLKKEHPCESQNNRQTEHRCVMCSESATMGRRCQVSFQHDPLDGFSEKIIAQIPNIQEFQ